MIFDNKAEFLYNIGQLFMLYKMYNNINKEKRKPFDHKEAREILRAFESTVKIV